MSDPIILNKNIIIFLIKCRIVFSESTQSFLTIGQWI